jgi:hypothetical protein
VNPRRPLWQPLEFPFPDDIEYVESDSDDESEAKRLKHDTAKAADSQEPAKAEVMS